VDGVAAHRDVAGADGRALVAGGERVVDLEHEPVEGGDGQGRGMGGRGEKGWDGGEIV